MPENKRALLSKYEEILKSFMEMGKYIANLEVSNRKSDVVGMKREWRNCRKQMDTFVSETSEQCLKEIGDKNS